MFDDAVASLEPAHVVVVFLAGQTRVWCSHADPVHAAVILGLRVVVTARQCIVVAPLGGSFTVALLKNTQISGLVFIDVNLKH